MKSVKYYDPTPVITKQRNLNFIVGSRGYGKTYGFKKYVIKQAIRGKGKFIYMRRKRTEIDSLVDFFGDLANDEWFTSRDIVFRSKGNELFYADTYDEDEKPEWKHIGSLVALSTQATLKSREFGDYVNMIFDEWLPLFRNEFLRGELDMFASLIDTVFRDRNFQIFCLANSSLMFNPYFEYFDINLAENLTKEFIYHERSILVQLVPSDYWSEYRKTTPLGMLFKETDYDKYASGNEFSDNDGVLVEDMPKRAKNIMVMLLDGQTVGVWFDMDTSWIYFSEKYDISTKEKYAFDYDEINEDFQSAKNIFNSSNFKKILRARRNGDIRFTSKKAKVYSQPITDRLNLL